MTQENLNPPEDGIEIYGGGEADSVQAEAAPKGGMKSCFGKELAARFGPGTAPIGTDPLSARKECYSCPDIDRCALVVGLVIQHRAR